MIDLNEFREANERDDLTRKEIDSLIEENLALRGALVEQACKTAYFNGHGEVEISTVNALGELVWRRYLTPSARALLDPGATA